MSNLNDSKTKKSILKERLEKNFIKALQKDTELSLGDRREYIGASDISGCLRKSFLSKKEQKNENSIEQLLTFERGHQFENIVEKFLYGETYKKQVEVKDTFTSNGFRLKPHLDFVLYNLEQKTATVIEAKSTKNVIELYESYVLQLQLQMGLLQAQCGSEWKIDGAIFVVSTDSKYELFEIEQNSTLFNMAVQRADELAHALKTNIEPKAEIQLYCDKCPFKGDCQAISKGANNQLPFNVKATIRKLKEFQNIEKEIKNLKKQIQTFMETTNTNVAKCNDITVSIHTNKGDDYTIDINKLRIEEPNVYAKYRIPTKKYNYLKII